MSKGILRMGEVLWSTKPVEVYMPESVTWTIFQQVVDVFYILTLGDFWRLDLSFVLSDAI